MYKSRLKAKYSICVPSAYRSVTNRYLRPAPPRQGGHRQEHIVRRSTDRVTALIAPRDDSRRLKFVSSQSTIHDDVDVHPANGSDDLPDVVSPPDRGEPSSTHHSLH